MIRNCLCRMIDSAQGRRGYKRLKELRSLEYSNFADVQRVQQQKLFALLQHAYKHIPYYSALLKQHGIVDARGNVHLERFQDIPILTKDIIRARFEDLKSDDLERRNWRFNQSGGSTGEPARFIQDARYDDWKTAIKHLFDIWSGCHPGHKKSLLWGAERDLFVGQETLRVRFSRWVRNHRWLNAFRMTPETMIKYVENLNDFNPDQILAYAESLYDLSRFIKLNNMCVKSPRAVMTSGGMLFPHMRRAIEEIFKVVLYNRYGSREVGDIACECEKHNGFHLVPLTHYVEILNPDGTTTGPGEMGDIVVTLLTNSAMPLIRYKIGDLGIFAQEACSCGRTWPLLKEVCGRSTDSFKRRDGGVVPPEYFAYLMSVLLNKNFYKSVQIIQEDYDVVRVKLVLCPQFKTSTDAVVQLEFKELENKIKFVMHEFKELEDKIKFVLGKDCRIVLDVVEDIPVTPTGKHRHILSLVKQ